jgi:C-terminal processing protease CtpA/Prc
MRTDHSLPSASLGGVLFLLGVLTGLALFGIARILSGDAEEEDLSLYRGIRNAVEHSTRVSAQVQDQAAQAAGLERGQGRVELGGGLVAERVVFRRPLDDGRVLFPMPDSPAERAGVRVGDRVLSIDGVPLEEIGAAGLQKALQVPEGEVLVVELEDRTGAQRTARIEPAEVVDPTVRHADLLDEERGIGYLTVRSFSHETPAELDAALAALEARGLRGLVLDLRGNPGGVLDGSRTSRPSRPRAT